MTVVLLGRHGKSTINIGELAFGNEGAPLTKPGQGNAPFGEDQAREMGTVFRDSYGVDPVAYRQPVGVSIFLRSQQTAELVIEENLLCLSH